MMAVMGTAGLLPSEAADEGAAAAAAWGVEDATRPRTGGPLSSSSSPPPPPPSSTNKSVLGASSSSSSSSSQHPPPQWWWQRRGRLSVVGFGMVFVTTAALGRLALDARMLALLWGSAGTTTPTTTATTTPKPAHGRSHGTRTNANSKNTDEREEPSSSLASSTSSYALLPWEPWDGDAMTKGRCRAPSNVPNKCCVGTDGGRFPDRLCPAKGTEPYNRVRARAADFLRQHPVPPPKLPSLLATTGWLPFSFPSTRAARSPVAPTDDCDTCRIVDHLIAHNYTLTFQGDSVMGQAFTGFECELRRRGYEVNSTTVVNPHINWARFRYGLQWTTTLRIAQAPGLDDDSNNSREATVVFRRMYRPIGDMREVATGLNVSDIFVFDHGLHYMPQRNSNMKEFGNSTAAILAVARNSPRTKLVVWKETTPQHFNTSSGLWDGKVGPTCVPITEGHDGGRRAIVERAARNAGYSRVVNATNIPSGGEGQPSPNGATDLVVLPYRDFMVPLHDMHGRECTHYCASPSLYVPLWRSLRLALDAYLPS